VGTSLSGILSLLPVGSAVVFAVVCAILVARAENRSEDRRAG
jgi:hypothetical protein